MFLCLLTTCTTKSAHRAGVFPVGRLVRDDGQRTLVFTEDGEWSIYYADLPEPVEGLPPDVSGRYGVSGEYYTEMTHDASSEDQIPVTYEWEFDGERLTFELFSASDPLPSRKACLDGYTYVLVN